MQHETEQKQAEQKQQRFEQQLEACRTEIQLELRVQSLEAQLATLSQQPPPTPDWNSLSNRLSESCKRILTDSLAPLLERVERLETFRNELTTTYNETVEGFNRSTQAFKAENQQLKAEIVSLQAQMQALAATVANLQEQSQKKRWFG